MTKPIKRISRSENPVYRGEHRYEHWLVDNQVYFITARCRDRFPALAAERAKEIFWDRFEHYTAECGFTPWVTSVLDNHCHTLGYLREGAMLSKMMQRLHGSVAKLVNDLLPGTPSRVLARREVQGVFRRLHSGRKTGAAGVSLYANAVGAAWTGARLARVCAYARECGVGAGDSTFA